MKSTSIFGIDEATLETSRKMLDKVFAQQPSAYKKCPAASGLTYAHLEIKNEGSIYKSYTCADDETELTKLFQFIRALKP